MSAETADILRKAKALIDTPEKWCKGHYCCNADGLPVSTLDPTAICFCIDGAFVTVQPRYNVASIHESKARLALQSVIGRHPLIIWNDAPERTHSEVMSAFDRAIQQEEQGE